jgi:hypothetical protein
MLYHCIAQGSALSLFSGKFNSHETNEPTIRKLADQSLSIPLLMGLKQ